jgi:hypothetical protein
MEPGSDAPAQVVAVALDLGTGAIRDIEPIKHGLTNRSWLVSTAGDRFVVRISDVGSAGSCRSIGTARPSCFSTSPARDRSAGSAL